MSKLLTRWIFVATVFLSVCSSKYGQHLRLIRNLQKNQDENLLPFVANVVNVSLGVSLHQIIDVDEKRQTLITNMWLRMGWMNPFLRWNESEYGGIKVINMRSDLIWKPDVVLYNSVSDELDIGGYLDKIQTRVIIYSNGRCHWLAPAVLKSHCEINIRYFPFDEQLCKLKFGSWTFDGTRLDLIPESSKADLGKHAENGEWRVISIPASRNVIRYICCDEPYVDVTYKLRIRRKPLFYAFNLILPCVIITVLTLLSFLLPPESGERVTLSITIILAMTVFMLMVAENIPPNSDALPLIAVYYYAAMIEEALALMAICFTLNWYYCNPKIDIMPNWIRKYVLGSLASLLRINKQHYRCYALTEERYISFHKGFRKLNLSSDKNSVTLKNLKKQNQSNQDVDVILNPGSSRRSSHDSVLEGGEIQTEKEIDVDGSPKELWKRNITRALQTPARPRSPNDAGSPFSEAPMKFYNDVAVMAESVRNRERLDSDMDEWRLAAAIVDKILFWIFVVTVVGTTLAIFLQVSSLYDD